MSKSSPHLLLVEDDLNIQELMEQLLCEEGYDVVVAVSLDEAFQLVSKHTFDLIMTDAFPERGQNPLSSVEGLRLLAHPTPVGIMTAWPLSDEKAYLQGFACLIKKPFDLDDFLTTVAACLNIRLTPEQERQAALVRRFFAALERHELEEALALCTEDFTYHPPETIPAPVFRSANGKVAYRVLLEQMLAYFGAFRYEGPLIFAHPLGLAVRYGVHWTTPDGVPRQGTDSLLVYFEGDRVAQVGRDPGGQRGQASQEFLPAPLPPRSPLSS
jgi:DNA-binding response OmpR family regulator